MKVFISYSRIGPDRAIAGLLTNALNSIGLHSLFDEGMHAGAYVADRVDTLIREADVFILILTKNSENSIWINQELGFARALYKPIVPIQVDESVQPSGMLGGIRQFECTNWFSHDGSLERLKSDIYAAVDQAEPPPTVIPTETERTLLLIERLRHVHEELDEKPEMRLRLYERSALSIFSVDSEAPAGYASVYWRQLCEQRKTMEALINHERVETRLHMWPSTRVYNPTARVQRLDILLNWLEGNEHSKGLQVLVAPHDGPNTLAVEDLFAFEGLRTSSEGEYIYTLHWRYPSAKVSACFSEFDGGDWSTPRAGAAVLRRLEDQATKDSESTDG